MALATSQTSIFGGIASGSCARLSNLMTESNSQPNTVSGPVASLSVWQSLTSSQDLKALKKNGFVVPVQTVRLQGAVVEGFTGDLTVTHEAMGQTLSQKRVRDLKGGRFDIKVRLLRGRNTFCLSGSHEPGQQFQLDLFHRSTVREWTESILKALVLVLIVKTFVVQAFFIPTESMKSTLLVGDYLLVDKVTHMFWDPKPGEIIVFEYPEDPSKDFIKRMVAGPGDRIAHIDNTLIYNGKPLKETYTQYIGDDPARGFISDHRSFPEQTIEKGKYWVMGDNRNNSQDSRYWGALPAWRLIGKAWGAYWPIYRAGLIRHTFGTPAK